MKKHLYIKEHKIPIYRGLLVIILTNDKKRLKKYVPSFKDSDIYAHTWYCNWKKTQGYVIILNFDNKHRKIYNGCIAHEALHAANMIADDRGITPSFTNDEPIAYLTEWFVDKIHKFVNDHKFKAR